MTVTRKNMTIWKRIRWMTLGWPIVLVVCIAAGILWPALVWLIESEDEEPEEDFLTRQEAVEDWESENPA